MPKSLVNFILYLNLYHSIIKFTTFFREIEKILLFLLTEYKKSSILIFVEGNAPLAQLVRATGS